MIINIGITWGNWVSREGELPPFSRRFLRNYLTSFDDSLLVVPITKIIVMQLLFYLKIHSLKCKAFGSFLSK